MKEGGKREGREGGKEGKSDRVCVNFITHRIQSNNSD